jgi:sialate O-acetylesterase
MNTEAKFLRKTAQKTQLIASIQCQRPIFRPMKKTRIAIAAVSLACLAAVAYWFFDPFSFRVARLLRDHAVLQRDMPVPVWGWGKPGSFVHLSLKKLDGRIPDTESYQTTVGENGEWKIMLQPHKAGGPYRLSIFGQLNYRWCNDLYFGDVWLCAGQSNMSIKVKDSDGFAEAIAAPPNPSIRYFRVKTEGSETPCKDLRWGKWQLDEPDLRRNFSALPYYFAAQLQTDLGVPIGVINASVGSSRIESWMPASCFGQVPVAGAMGVDFSSGIDVDISKDLPSQLYNSMVHPAHPFPVKGVIWWQGESDTEQATARKYQQQFSCLIRSWREAQGDSLLPFLYVQLANIGQSDKQKIEADWPMLREAQSLVLQQFKQVAQVVSFDISHPTDVHPGNKKGIAERLALAAGYVAYGKKVPYSGPVFQQSERMGHKLRLHFDPKGKGLSAKPSYAPLNGFKVAGADRVFHPAKAAIEGNTVLVWSEKVPSPVAARYAWERSPFGSNLFNKEGLPASPFRTDDW